MSQPWPKNVPQFVLERATALGLAYYVFWSSRFPQSSSWLIPAYVGPAIALGQIEFGFAETGAPEALLSWAYLSDKTSEELVSNPYRELHISEWNEGLNLWVMALFAPPGRSAALLRTNLQNRLSGFERLRGFRRSRDGTILGLADKRIPRTPRSC